MIIDIELLLSAYCNGYFPMADSKDGEISWYSPDPRTIFEINAFHTPYSLKKTLKSNPFEFRINTKFQEVMLSCANREDTWISEDILNSYFNLYKHGFAYSFESFQNDKLVGGLYGVAIGGAFFGESMFHTVTDASKAALVFLVNHLKKREYSLLDTQYLTPHLEKFGAIEIPRNEYLKKLENAIKLKRSIIE